MTNSEDQFNGPEPIDEEAEDISIQAKELNEALRQEQDAHLRLLAEFDNYRKRVDRERTRAAREGKRELILKLLGIVDGFDQALAHSHHAPGKVEEGIKAIQRQLMNVLQAEGVAPFESVGEKFDPDLHEAVTTDPADGSPEGTVVREFQRGYRWGSEVLRHAKVSVAK